MKARANAMAAEKAAKYGILCYRWMDGCMVEIYCMHGLIDCDRSIDSLVD